MKVGEGVAELYGFIDICRPVSLSSFAKVIVYLEMKYVMGNDETSMSPELTQDHSGDA